MGAFKKLEGRFLFVDMSEIKVPSWFQRELTKAAMRKHRAIKKVDPFARCLGRRRKFETAEQLKEACDAYFKSQECFIYDRFGKPIKNPETGELLVSTKPLTLAGLSRAIGVQTKSLYRYDALAKSGCIPPEFSTVVQEALQRIEEYAERRIYDKDGQRGAQFVLQARFNWATPKEKRETKDISIKNKIALEKLEMDKERHEIQMELLRAGLSNDEDNEIEIKITRAKKGE